MYNQRVKHNARSSSSIPEFLSVRRIRPHNSCELRLPLVAIGQQFLFVIQQLFSRLSSILGIRSLHNSVDGATLLAESTVDAFGHVDVVSSRPSATVFAFLGFDCDSLSGADGFAELAGDATFFTGGIPPEGMFATEAWRYRAFLEGVVDGVSEQKLSAIVLYLLLKRQWRGDSDLRRSEELL